MSVIYKNVPMSLEEANAFVENYNLAGATERAVRLYLSGVCKTRATAARVAGVHQKAIDRAIERMEKVPRKCPCCGIELTELRLRGPKVEEEDDE